jgi:potassium efflux system protein
MVASRSSLACAIALKKTLILFVAMALCLLPGMRMGLCQEAPVAPPTPVTVSSSILEAKIAATEAAGDMDEEAKNKLLSLYRKALSNLQTAAANAQAAEGFREAAAAAPKQIGAIRKAMANAPPPKDTLDVDSSASLREIEQHLQKEKADLAAVDAKRADREKRLEEENGRPGVIQQRLTEAREQQEKVTAQLELPSPTEEGPVASEARRWVLQTRFDTLSSEIKMLDEELLSRPMRVDLLEAERDKAAASVQWVGSRVKLLQKLVNDKRKEEAAKAKAEAEEIRRKAEGEHPSVVHLAEQNAALTEELAQMASRIGELAHDTAKTDGLAVRIETGLERAKDAVDAGGLTQELAHILLRQSQSLPSLRAQGHAAKERVRQAAEISVQRLRHQEEQTLVQDPDAYLATIQADMAPQEETKLRGQLRELASNRGNLLKEAIDADDLYLRRLEELETAQRRLLGAVKDYDALVDQRLLWVRSTSLFQLGKRTDDSRETWRFLSPNGWREVGRTLAYQAAHSPVLALVVAVLAVLLWGRGRLIELIRGLRAKLGKPTTDRFGFTLLALGVTLIAATPWPLLTAASGWQLNVSPEATDFGSALGVSLVAVATYFYCLRVLRFACIPGGLCAAHFRWPESSLQLLRTGLDRLTWIFLPAALGAMLAAKLDPLDVDWLAWRLFFLVAVSSLALAFYRLLHPKRGVLASYLRDPRRRSYKHLYRFGYSLTVVFPLALGVLSLLGYRNGASALTELFLKTVWLAVTLVFTSALAERWLLVSRRKLAYEAAMERLESRADERRPETARLGGEEASPHDIEEPEVDVVALSDTSRKLINTVILLYGLVGLWLIWSEVFPALRILDEVALWHHKVMVDGEEQILPVTLASLCLALIYTGVTIILARQLPAVLEIVLLHSSGMSAGSRYTVTTVTNYAIVTVGLVLVFKTLGTDWSQLQWLVAALGVGIGFGLQEIVANFISGIIVLFERPIRIGDVITVGDTDGVVTRIRSRATTIRNWDGKELLVPNKEFITERLLNWSLSDQTTRVILSIGIAYGSDVRRAMHLLEEAARENENVLDDPPPSVIFESFGDNSLAMALRCFVDSADLRYPTISALNVAINDKLDAAGIVIAFPQRDLHLDTTCPLQVEVRRDRPGPSDKHTPDNGAG